MYMYFGAASERTTVGRRHRDPVFFGHPATAYDSVTGVDNRLRHHQGSRDDSLWQLVPT